MASSKVSVRLAVLKKRAKAADITLTNLAATLGMYQGLNNRLQRGSVAGPGAHALTIILFDLVHLIAIRTNALLVAPWQKDDVTLQTFVQALDDPDVCDALVARCAEDFSHRLYDADFVARQRARTVTRIAAIRRRYDMLDKK